MRIRLKWRNKEIQGQLNDSETARRFFDSLPIESRANTWGDEVYFALPLDTTLEDSATDVVDPGTICYWVEGKSLALPFGPTPMSEALECRLASPANTLGKLQGDPQILRTIGDGTLITVEAC